MRNTAIIAGDSHARCDCCVQRQTLVNHPDLDLNHRVCPSSGSSYLDRGDGVFEAQPMRVDPPAPRSPSDPTSDLLSDRPTQTGPKTRIELERATFAAGGR